VVVKLLPVVDFRDSGELRVEPEPLLERLAESEDLAPFRKLIKPLIEYDRERRSGLVRTLRVYFLAGTNASEAADRLFLHRNSMLYRLARVEKLTGLDLKDPWAVLALQLGLLSIDQQRRSSKDATEHP
jgi:DNA-binding PucR family transcriptional regulator